MRELTFKEQLENILRQFLFELNDNVTRKKVYKKLKKSFPKGTFYVFDYDDNNHTRMDVIAVYKGKWWFARVEGSEFLI
jgi:glyoxylate carboligase